MPPPDLFEPSPEAAAIARITARAEPRLRRAFLRAIREVRDQAALTLIERALQRGRLPEALAAVPWSSIGTEALSAEILPPWRAAFEGAGQVAVDSVAADIAAAALDLAPRGPATAEQLFPPALPPAPPSVPPAGSPGAPGGPPRRLKFEVLNPRPMRFLERHGAELVTEIGEPTRQALRESLVTMTRQGWDHRTAAKDLIRHIGLTSRLAAANRNYRLALEKAGRLSPAAIDRLVAQHAARLLMYRGIVISRTESKYATGNGQHIAWQQMIDKRLIDPKVAQVIWETSLLESVCKICAPMHRQTRTLAQLLAGELFLAGDGRHVAMPGDTHPQCLPGDQLVTMTPGVLATSVRHYDGDLVVIRTASNKQLACTPNHPILTPRGWLPASALHVGDDVVGRRGSDRPNLRGQNHQHIPALIHQVSDASRRAAGMTAREVPLAAEDFHGDGRGSDVATVWAYGLLLDDIDAALPEQACEADLQGRHAELELLARLSARDLGAEVLGLPPYGGMGGGYHPLSFSRIDAPCPHQASGLTTSSRRNADASQPPDDGGPTDAQLAREIQNGLAGEVFADDVVNVDVQNFSGHVFNLQTDGGYYIAADIVTHNCVCSRSLLPRGIVTGRLSDVVRERARQRREAA